MSIAARFDEMITRCPLIAILRGITPDEAVKIGHVLFDSGLRVIEVPLNSPDPFESIARLVRTFGDDAIIGAGTVTSIDEVRKLSGIGAAAVISPHCDPAIIRASVDAGMLSLPGILSPTEAFSALHAGAHALKLFPMEMIGANGVKAMRAVLPKKTSLVAVGGVSRESIASFKAAGCTAFGVGSTLYKPGDDALTVQDKAATLIAAIPYHQPEARQQ